MVGLFIHRALNQISLLFGSLEAANTQTKSSKSIKNIMWFSWSSSTTKTYTSSLEVESKNKTVRHMVQWLGHSEL